MKQKALLLLPVHGIAQKNLLARRGEGFKNASEPAPSDFHKLDYEP